MPKFFVYRCHRIIVLEFTLTFDFSEGRLETFRAAQLHFLILLIALLVWCQLESQVPWGPLARFGQK